MTPTSRAGEPVAVEQIMDRLRQRIRERRAPAAAGDLELLAAVERTVEEALGLAAGDELLLPELLGREDEWRLEPHLRITSHRPLAGRFLVFLKRRLLLPALRWLYEHGAENFRRQDRLNRLYFALIEVLARENARLRRDLRRLAERGGGAPDA